MCTVVTFSNVWFSGWFDFLAVVECEPSCYYFCTRLKRELLPLTLLRPHQQGFLPDPLDDFSQ